MKNGGLRITPYDETHCAVVWDDGETTVIPKRLATYIQGFDQEKHDLRKQIHDLNNTITKYKMKEDMEARYGKKEG